MATGLAASPTGEPDVFGTIDSRLDEGRPLDDLDTAIAALCRVHNLGTVIRELLEARAMAADRLATDSEPAPVEGDTLVETSAAMALGAATAGVSGAIGAALAAKVASPLVREFYKSAAKDLVDDLLGESITGAVRGHGADPSDARLPFFRGQADALRRAATRVELELMNPSRIRAVAATPDLALQLVAAQSTFDGLTTDAQVIQYRESLLAWTRMLAQSDLGTSADGTTNMADTHGNYGLIHDWFGTDARGVLKVDLWSNRPGREPTLQGAKMYGLNQKMVETLAGETPDSAAIPVEVDLHLDRDGLTQREFGVAEASVDERGRVAYTGEDAADRWLALHLDGFTSERDAGAADVDPSVAPAVAAAIVQRATLHQTFAQLGVVSA